MTLSTKVIEVITAAACLVSLIAVATSIYHSGGLHRAENCVCALSSAPASRLIHASSADWKVCLIVRRMSFDLA
jgi:hypothetical protein